MACLEELRSLKGGAPLRIISGYRTVATNTAVGGARNSQHLTGSAADIPAGYCTVAEAEQAGFTGIGYCAGSAVHVDVRGGPVVKFADCPKQ